MAIAGDAIAIVLDVGKCMHNDKSYPTALEEAKKCISMIIQRKIFSESKDVIALILFGSCNISSNLAEEKNSEFTNISVIQELQPASWKLYEFVNEIQGTDLSTDFIVENALLTAINLLQNITNIKKNSSRKILFLSCFDGYFYDDKANTISDELKSHNIELNVIGPVAFPVEDVKNEASMQVNENESMQIKSESCISDILREVNGESYTFSDVLHVLSNYEMKKVQPSPWNANLDIGTNLTIPISAYIKVSESKPKTWKTAYAHNFNAQPERKVTFNMNDESQTKVSKDDVIPAFKFGTTLVPYSADDKKNMEYQSHGKGMMVLGFTKAENVQRYLYVGDKSKYVFGQKSKELAGEILASFIQALRDTNMVAIVRYASTQKSAPSIGFLSPRIKPNYECLIFVPLPFMEDLRHLVFAPLDTDSKNLPTEEQLNAVDDLITAMDLTVPVDEEEEECLKPKNIVNPYLQRLYQCLQYRASHPEKPLPGIEPRIEVLVNPSPKLLKRAEMSLKEIKSIFPIKETAPKKPDDERSHLFPNRKSDESIKKHSVSEDFVSEVKFDVTEAKLIDAVTDKIIKVGTVNPVRDIQYLINNNVLPFNDICEQINDVVIKLLQDSDRLRFNHSKILSVCKEFRCASLKEADCEKYNSFMCFLQKHLLEVNEELWNKIINEKIGLISKEEMPSSTVSSEQAEVFLSKPCVSEDNNSVKDIVSHDDLGDDDIDDLMEQF